MSNNDGFEEDEFLEAGDDYSDEYNDTLPEEDYSSFESNSEDFTNNNVDETNNEDNEEVSFDAPSPSFLSTKAGKLSLAVGGMAVLIGGTVGLTKVDSVRNALPESVKSIFNKVSGDKPSISNIVSKEPKDLPFDISQIETAKDSTVNKKETSINNVVKDIDINNVVSNVSVTKKDVSLSINKKVSIPKIEEESIDDSSEDEQFSDEDVSITDISNELPMFDDSSNDINEVAIEEDILVDVQIGNHEVELEDINNDIVDIEIGSSNTKDASNEVSVDTTTSIEQEKLPFGDIGSITNELNTSDSETITVAKVVASTEENLSDSTFDPSFENDFKNTIGNNKTLETNNEKAILAPKIRKQHSDDYIIDSIYDLEDRIDLLKQKITNVAVERENRTKEAEAAKIKEMERKKAEVEKVRDEYIKFEKAEIKKAQKAAVVNIVANKDKDESLKKEADVSKVEQEKSKNIPVESDTVNKEVKATAVVEDSVVTASEVVAAESDKEKKIDLRDGRKRLPGFKIINKTADGTMSIAKTPSGRVSVFFKDERLRVSFTRKSLKVTGIEEDGNLMLIDDKYFIDTTLTNEKIVIKKTSSKKVTKKRTKKRTKKANKKRSRSKVNRVSKENAKKWSLHGKVNNNDYIVMDHNEKWLTISKGSYVKGLGKVNGINKNGNLSIGSHIIYLSE